MALVLHGLKVSVYTRMVRFALAEKAQDYRMAEANPFADPPTQGLDALTRFNRIPVLEDGAFRLHETRAILAYLDALMPGPDLRPAGAKTQARVVQVCGIVDAYAYWPLVRQVFSHRVFRPSLGEPADESTARAGLAGAVPVLDTLEEIAAEGLVLNRGNLSQADFMLGPVIDYFAMAPEGASLLDARPFLRQWFDWLAQNPGFLSTRSFPGP